MLTPAELAAIRDRAETLDFDLMTLERSQADVRALLAEVERLTKTPRGATSALSEPSPELRDAWRAALAEHGPPVADEESSPALAMSLLRQFVGCVLTLPHGGGEALIELLQRQSSGEPGKAAETFVRACLQPTDGASRNDRPRDR